ncbi:MAG: trehalase family glycosidase [bacterium]|nr:trehalase family glycosidase [bacterium]
MNKLFEYCPKALPSIICERHPEWVELYDTAWRLAFVNVEYPDKPGWKPQLSCMPGSGNIWQWDSCFMALFARFSNGTLPCMNNLDNLYRLQAQDGYMSMAYSIATEKDAFGQRVNPPLFSWVEWEYYLVTGDDGRFEIILPRLIRYFDWIKANRTRINGLYWFEDSGSTGMDNSPRSGYNAVHQDGSDICFIDLACQQALSALYLTKIARYIDQEDIADRFVREHHELCCLINRYHWCQRMGMYFDLFARSIGKLRHNFLNHKTTAAFWSIISMAADDRQVDSLMEHIFNPDEFWTIHPLPALSKDDPNYSPLGNYWLGGVWAPIDYMLAKGLAVRGRTGAARDIAIRHIAAMAEVMKNEAYGGIWECYSPEYLRPASPDEGGNLVRNNFVGWSGLGPISMLIENVLGMNFDAASNSITWLIGMEGEHGIGNLLFNRRNLSLLCHNNANTGRREVAVETTDEINLILRLEGKSGEHRLILSAGQHQIVIP